MTESRKDCDMSEKKRLFFYTDICPLLSREDDAINKIRRVLAEFEKHRDEIYVVWTVYEQFPKQIEDLNARMGEAFIEQVEVFNDMGIGEFVISDSPRDVLKTCDAFYGDVNEILYYAKEYRIPAMLSNIDI